MRGVKELTEKGKKKVTTRRDKIEDTEEENERNERVDGWKTEKSETTRRNKM